LSEQSRASKNQNTEKKRRVIKPPALASQADAASGADLNSAWHAESVDEQAAVLQRMPAAQRQATIQRMAQARGNRHVQRVTAAFAKGKGKGRRSSAPAVQAKLAVGEAGDRYEREADRVAEAVVRGPQATPSAPSDGGNGAHTPGSVEAPAEQIQASGESVPAVSSEVETRIDGLRGRGSPLPQSERTFFEERFGADFGEVRVHDDDDAARTAQDLNARAYTLGNDVVFNSGQYEPGSERGRRLMAHELTHVVQQRGVNRVNREIQRQPDDGQETYVVQPGEGLLAIAQKLGTTVEMLKEANRDKLRTWNINGERVEGFEEGTVIIVPSMHAWLTEVEEEANDIWARYIEAARTGTEQFRDLGDQIVNSELSQLGDPMSVVGDFGLNVVSDLFSAGVGIAAKSNPVGIITSLLLSTATVLVQYEIKDYQLTRARALTDVASTMAGLGHDAMFDTLETAGFAYGDLMRTIGRIEGILVAGVSSEERPELDKFIACANAFNVRARADLESFQRAIADTLAETRERLDDADNRVEGKRQADRMLGGRVIYGTYRPPLEYVTRGEQSEDWRLQFAHYQKCMQDVYSEGPLDVDHSEMVAGKCLEDWLVIFRYSAAFLDVQQDWEGEAAELQNVIVSAIETWIRRRIRIFGSVERVLSGGIAANYDRLLTGKENPITEMPIPTLGTVADSLE
jgi:hypothetical protein